MIIIITGTPGTGKSVIAAHLSKKLGYGLLDIKKIVNQTRIYNIEKTEKIVDSKKLEKILLQRIRNSKKKDIIIEGHLACEIKLNAMFAFVLRCKLSELEKRLKKRKYSKEKINENLLAEMLDYCTLNAMKNFNKRTRIVEIDTSKRSIHKNIAEIISILHGKKKEIDHVDYSRELRKFTREQK